MAPTLLRRRLKSRGIAALALSGLLLPVTALASAPNIVLVLAKDLGFTDIAPYGSEIKTPSFSALAENGSSFNNYHTSASCAPCC